MAHSNEFIKYLLELLEHSGDITADPMFGGYGLFFNSQIYGKIMFALVADDVLYFKTDDKNRAEFEGRGLDAFKYERSGKTLSMSYHEAPGETLDDADEMALWANTAIEAAKRNAARKPTK